MLLFQVNICLLGVLLGISNLCFSQTLPKSLFPDQNLYDIQVILDGNTNSSNNSIKTTNQLNLQDAIALAMGNNFELLQSKKDLDSAHSLYTGSVQDFYVPNLNTVLSGTSRDLFTTSKNPQDIAATAEGFNLDFVVPSITLSKTVFTGFSNLHSYRIAKENYLNAQNTYTNTMCEIIYQTTIRYYDQFLKQEEVGVAIERLRQLEDQLKQAQINYRNGRVSDFDVSISKSHFYSAQPAYYTAERERVYAQEDFYRYLRYKPEPFVYTQLTGSLLDVTNVVFSEFDEDVSMDFVLKSDTTIATLRAAYNNSKSQKGKNNALRMPKIDVQFSYLPSWGRDVAIGNFAESAYNGVVSLSAVLTVPLLEWIPGTGVAARVKASQAQIINSKYALLDAEEKKVIEIKNTLLKIRELSQSVRALKISEEQSARASQIARVQYRNGRISLIEFNQAQVDYIDSKKNFLRSIYNELQAKLFLQQAIHNLDEFIAEVEKLQKKKE